MMKKYLLIVACLVIAGWFVGARTEIPTEVKVLTNPAYDAQIKDLQARVTHLENWAVKMGGKY